MAPGRVNLIGEHTDYNDLPVLPMALDRSVVVEFRIADGPAVALDSPLASCPAFSFSLTEPIEAAVQGDWSNYVRAAAKGLLEHGVPLTRGIRGSVAGSVPLAAGLSSSSALVVGAALALLRANDQHLDDMELASLLARAERFVGLEGGGMDQTVCIRGRVGMAVRIDFAPLRTSLVPIPPTWRWVVAHSLIRAEKSGAARETYNTRARECREALAAMSSALGMPGARYPDLVSLEGVVDAAGDILDDGLFRRFRHVITEARRVDAAQDALLGERHVDFGIRMSASHASLRDDYEVSIPELDEMTFLAESAGAAGARLTGAGFGGCMVALCDESTAPAVREELTRSYYRPRGQRELADVLFEARPSEGARVLPFPPG